MKSLRSNPKHSGQTNRLLVCLVCSLTIAGAHHFAALSGGELAILVCQRQTGSVLLQRDHLGSREEIPGSSPVRKQVQGEEYTIQHDDFRRAGDQDLQARECDINIMVVGWRKTLQKHGEHFDDDDKRIGGAV